MLFMKKASYLHFDRHRRNERWLNSLPPRSSQEFEMRRFWALFEVRTRSASDTLALDRHSGRRQMAQRQRNDSTHIPSVRQDNSRPFLTQKALLNSLHAQQIFDRGYEMCANALFSLSVVLRFIGSEEQAQEVDALVDTQIDQTLEEIRKESLRLKEVAEGNGIETAIGYTSAKAIDVQITSPRSIKYLAIIREFDAMMTHLDALWLSCVISDSQYARGVYEWKRRILRLAGQIRQIATRAVLAARRKETGGVVAEDKELPAVEHRDLETAGTPDESSQTG
jgi:hypothetical protein